MEMVSVVIPTLRERWKLLDRLLKTIPKECEVITVDDEDLLLAAKRNKGAIQATRDYILFIDDDNYLLPSTLKHMLEALKDETIGIAGIVACYSTDCVNVADGGSLRNMTTGFTKGLYTNMLFWRLPKEPYEVDECANAFMMRRDLYYKLGGFDEINFPIDLDEADLCRRAKNLGYKIVYVPKAGVIHNSQTYSHIPNFRRPLNAYFMGRNRILYQRKFNTSLDFRIYLVFFMPVFVGFYILSLLYRKNPKMIKPFMEGVLDGICNRTENKYQI